MIRLLCLAALLLYRAEIDGAESLEWLAYDGDAIVRGKVLKRPSEG